MPGLGFFRMAFPYFRLAFRVGLVLRVGFRWVCGGFSVGFGWVRVALGWFRHDVVLVFRWA